MTLTYAEDQPWLLLDLGSVRDIASVTLHLRSECCSDNLDDAMVFVSEQTFASNNPWDT